MHKTYQLEISPAAKRDLKKLPNQVHYHFGRKPEYRIIYYLEDNVITVIIIGTREGIYKKAKRRKR
jgi:mRNA-degrading endonuclease RelE of RelBE toxin-antitoxin system